MKIDEKQAKKGEFPGARIDFYRSTANNSENISDVMSDSNLPPIQAADQTCVLPSAFLEKVLSSQGPSYISPRNWLFGARFFTTKHFMSICISPKVPFLEGNRKLVNPPFLILIIT